MRITSIRVERASHFVIVPNETARDESLSPEALGVLVYLLSHAEGFSVPVAAIRKRFGMGRDRTARILRELEAAGYIHRLQERDEKGRITWHMVVRDVPQREEAPSSGSSEGAKITSMHGFSGDGSPVYGSPVAGKPGDIKKTKVKKTSVKKTSSRSGAASEEVAPRQGKGGEKPEKERITRDQLHRLVRAWAMVTRLAGPDGKVPATVWPRLAREVKRAWGEKRKQMPQASQEEVTEALLADLRQVYLGLREWETPPSHSQVHQYLVWLWSGTWAPGQGRRGRKGRDVLGRDYTPPPPEEVEEELRRLEEKLGGAP